MAEMQEWARLKSRVRNFIHFYNMAGAQILGPTSAVFSRILAGSQYRPYRAESLQNAGLTFDPDWSYGF